MYNSLKFVNLIGEKESAGSWKEGARQDYLSVRAALRDGDYLLASRRARFILDVWNIPSKDAKLLEEIIKLEEL